MEPTFRVNITVLLIGIALMAADLVLGVDILSVDILEAVDSDSGRRQLNKRED